MLDSDLRSLLYLKKVVVRIRPVNRREREGVRIVQKLSSDAMSIEDRTYTFDHVLGPDSSQVEQINSSSISFPSFDFR